MAIADVGIHPIDHAGHAHALHHHVVRMIVHVHERIAALLRNLARAFGDELERLAQAGQRTVLDAIGDDREHAIEQRRDRVMPLDWRIGVRNLAQAGARRIDLCSFDLRADEAKKTPARKF